MRNLTLPTSVQPENIIRFIEKEDTKAKYQVDKLVYYPYYFFKYKVKAKGLLKLDGYLGCTIDSISARGAMIDSTPVFIEENLEEQSLIPSSLSSEKAKEIAEDFVNHSASLKLKFFTMPKLNLEQYELFYRPYWIIVSQRNSEKYPTIMIDGISGKYHPLNM